MTLLDSYLKAVRMYLPSNGQQDDIAAELGEHLQSVMDERASDLGRPLTEREQESILTQHGNPLLVAERYGARRLSLAIGWELIGPEVFPLYARIVALNWIVTLAAVPIVNWLAGAHRPLTWSAFVFPMTIQLVIVTIIFTGVDALQRYSRRRAAAGTSPRNWRFPPSHLQPVPRWQSVAGLVLLGSVAIWWAAIPVVPSLLLGRASTSIDFTPSWQAIYWPYLFVLVVGAVQRAATLVRPEWNWLQAITRLFTNSAALILLVPFAQNHPYVAAAASASDVATASVLADRINGGLWWIAMGTLSIYWAIGAGFHAWFCAQHLRSSIRRRAEQLS